MSDYDALRQRIVAKYGRPDEPHDTALLRAIEALENKCADFTREFASLNQVLMSQDKPDAAQCWASAYHVSVARIIDERDRLRSEALALKASMPETE